MESLDVDILMNSKSEWGHNSLPRDRYHDNGPGNRATVVSNSPGDSNRETDKISNTTETKSNKRQHTETEDEFSQLWTQKRLRRRLATQTDEQQPGNQPEATTENQQHCVANPDRPGLYSALKWNGIHRARIRLRQQSGNKVRENSNKKQQDLKKSANLNQKFLSIENWIKSAKK